MKEIDFLPDWYKQGRVQQKKHREFYFALGLVMCIMAVWSIFANGRAAIVKARNTNLQSERIKQAEAEAEYSAADSEYQQLKAEAETLKSVESKITVSDVIAELTYQLGGKVVLKKIEIKGEPIKNQNNQTSVKSASAAASEQAMPFKEDKKYKIIINGFAADAAEVAEIINRLEDSKYFFQIVPVFSKNVKFREYQACEFEINCYLANYKQN
jgi:cell division protein FtsB